MNYLPLLLILLAACVSAGNMVIGNGNCIRGDHNLIHHGDHNSIVGNNDQIIEGFRNKILGNFD